MTPTALANAITYLAEARRLLTQGDEMIPVWRSHPNDNPRERPMITLDASERVCDLAGAIDRLASAHEHLSPDVVTGPARRSLLHLVERLTGVANRTLDEDDPEERA